MMYIDPVPPPIKIVPQYLPVAERSLAQRIWAAVKEVFYFVFRCARKDFAVTVISDSSAETDKAAQFLKKHLSYQYKLNIVNYSTSKAHEADLVGKRVLLTFSPSASATELDIDGTAYGKVIDRCDKDASAKLLFLVMNDKSRCPNFRGQGWGKFTLAYESGNDPQDQHNIRIFLSGNS